MDLFKNCTTTVHVIEGFSVIHYRCYEMSFDDTDVALPERARALHFAELALRSRGILVTATSKTRLLLFSRSQEQLFKDLSAACPEQNVQETISLNDLPALHCKSYGCDIPCYALVTLSSQSHRQCYSEGSAT